MPEDEKVAEKSAEKAPVKAPEGETAKEQTRSAVTSEGIWICPWCGKDCLSERNYYYHLRTCDKCPEDKVADKDRSPVSELKKDESFIINIFEEKPEEKPKVENPTVKPPEKVEEEFPYVCGNCGAGMKKKEKYCPNCGLPLEWASG